LWKIRTLDSYTGSPRPKYFPTEYAVKKSIFTVGKRVTIWVAISHRGPEKISLYRGKIENVATYMRILKYCLPQIKLLDNGRRNPLIQDNVGHNTPH
jgi:hypothetical protein